MKTDLEIAKMHDYIKRHWNRTGWGRSLTKATKWKTKGRLISLEWLNDKERRSKEEILSRIEGLKKKLKISRLFPTTKYQSQGEIKTLEWALR